MKFTPDNAQAQRRHYTIELQFTHTQISIIIFLIQIQLSVEHHIAILGQHLQICAVITRYDIHSPVDTERRHIDPDAISNLIYKR